MKFFFLFLVLAVIGVKAKPQGQADASAGGNAQAGGCSVGTGGEGSADGNNADGGGQGSADGCDTSKKYTYTITAKRTSQEVPGDGSVVYLDDQISDPQSMTYFKRIDDKNPFVVGIYFANVKAGYRYANSVSNKVNACTDPDDGTWDYVAVKIIQGGLMPDGSCPVDPGEYLINQEVDPITVTFPKMMPCGDYAMSVNLDRGNEWALQVSYSFNIAKDDNCLSN